MAEYKVVEVTHLDLREPADGNEPKEFKSSLNEFCPKGWEIVSARFLAGQDSHKTVVVLSR
ncbi:hypothetical protein [Phosphitispora sp. TUW77]|uniref:hypothetical protein n=1 Tax=Phosphitispora sp. TUW77 TaxID=3152361 RepID=UPI003AB7E5AD